MTLYPIHAGYFKLDGGAMFGVVPKSLWQKTNPPDNNNMIEMATRCLLVEEGDRLILIDNGMGNKQSEKFFGYYYLWGDATLEKSLAQHGFTMDDVTDVFLTHLHFDHCGGSIRKNIEGTGYIPAFKNARYWSNSKHWEWAMKPNPRERPSFLKENIFPIKESGQLNFVDAKCPLNADGLYELFDGFRILCVNGHTMAMMIPHISFKNRTVVYVADLIPTHGHIPVPYLMGYDVRPLLTMEEKEKFYHLAVSEKYILFFEHDPYYDCATVEKTERGIRMEKGFMMSDINMITEH